MRLPPTSPSSASARVPGTLWHCYPVVVFRFVTNVVHYGVLICSIYVIVHKKFGNRNSFNVELQGRRIEQFTKFGNCEGVNITVYGVNIR